jgi:aminomethyltransferase
MDLSALRKFDVTGPDAETLLQKVQTRDLRKLAVGQVVYTAVCHAHGGMMDDGTVFRLGRDVFRFVCGEDTTGLWLREQAAAAGLAVQVRDATDALHNLAVQGPRSRELLQKILWTAPVQPAISELGWFRFTAARLGGPTGIPLVVSRTGYTGELGFELWCAPKDGPAVWEAVMQAGAPMGIVPLGFEALDMLRIEAGLAFAGQEFCDQTDPFEAGIGFTVALSRPDDFIGKAALEERKAHPRRKLVGLAIRGNEAASHGDGVYVGRAKVGEITSTVRSPVLDAQIALARVDVAYSSLETALQIGQLDGHRKRLDATVCAFPHYDPTKARVRA